MREKDRSRILSEMLSVEFNRTKCLTGPSGQWRVKREFLRVWELFSLEGVFSVGCS